jgi:hypothetical protein
MSRRRMIAWLIVLVFGAAGLATMWRKAKNRERWMEEQK